MKKKIWIALGVISLILVMVGIGIYQQLFSKGPEVETVEAKVEDISELLMIPGTLKFQEEQAVYPSPEKGEIEKIFVKEGQTVKAGDILVSFRNPQLNLELEQNKLAMESGYLKISQLRSQQQRLEEKEKELSKQIGKKEAEKQLAPEFDQINMEKRMADLELKQTMLQKDLNETRLKELEIKSLIDGTVITVKNQASADSEMAEPIVYIGSMDGLEASGLLSEYDTLKVKQGLKVRLRSDAVPDEEWEGEVTEISTLPKENPSNLQSESQAVQYPITGKITSKNVNLKPGFQMIMEIETNKKRAVVLPIDAVVQEQEKHFVYVLNGLEALKKEVKVGMTSGNQIEIQGGVKEGEIIINHPPSNLKTGMEVQTK